jgi:hypothetical protein
MDVLTVDVSEFLHASLKSEERRIDLSSNSTENRDDGLFGGNLRKRH